MKLPVYDISEKNLKTLIRKAKLPRYMHDTEEGRNSLLALLQEHAKQMHKRYESNILEDELSRVSQKRIHLTNTIEDTTFKSRYHIEERKKLHAELEATKALEKALFDRCSLYY